MSTIERSLLAFTTRYLKTFYGRHQDPVKPNNAAASRLMPDTIPVFFKISVQAYRKMREACLRSNSYFPWSSDYTIMTYEIELIVTPLAVSAE